MNRSPEFLDDSLTLSLDADPLPLRLSAGAAIFALRGTIWITQERLRDDVILAPGDRFDVKGGGLILAGAIKGGAVIHVVQRDSALLHVSRSIYDFARARALRLRREEFGRIAAHAAATVAAALAFVRRSPMPRRGAVSH